MRTTIHRLTSKLNLSQIIALTFLFIILIGAVLLTLTCSSKANGSIGFFTALFTATSSVCVTGLSLVDIWSSYTLFGQIVLLFLMEIGGLGFMSILSILFYLTGHKNDIQSLSLMAESIGSDALSDIVRIQKRLIIGSVSLELGGAFILFLTFIPSFGIGRALWYGLFHSISSFCNAGFDLMGINSPGSSLLSIQNNYVALITLSILIVAGGIGFIVWDDMVTVKSPKKWSVYTKLVLIISAVLLVTGSILFFLLEMNNPNTIANMPLAGKIVNSIFQSATTRTAGFASIDQGSLTENSVVLTILLMAVGGSAGSTAGGIKTVTIFILVRAIYSYAYGKKDVTIYERTITYEQISYALAVVGSFAAISTIGAFIINISSNVGMLASFYESVSALATVGLSLGVTSSLSVTAKILLIVFMYLGRVGLLTVSIGFFKIRENSAIKYPSVKLMV